MRKKFKIEVDCANCAAKIEDGIRRISGVNDVSISYMTQKIVLDADDDRFEEILSEAQKICKRIDSDSFIVV